MGQYARDNSLNHRKMKVLLACLLSVGLSSGFELKHEATTRTLRADTLRDFPNECFAATQCKVYKQGETWPLTPVCGPVYECEEGTEPVYIQPPTAAPKE